MNPRIRKLAAGLLVCYVVLFVQLNVLQVGQAREFRADARNTREVTRDFNKPRGPIVTADGDPTRPSPKDPAGRARAMQYDVVLNGWELGGGSVRIWRRDLLERSFALQGHSLEAMREKFGAILEAFEYGAPPHGGIAFGFDRIVMLLAGCSHLRDCIAFPKTASGSCLLTEAPAPVDEKQLEELHITVSGNKMSKKDV